MGQGTKRKNKRNIILLCVVLFVTAVICIVAAVFVGGQIKKKQYGANLTSARQYLLAENYEAAETAYRKSIELYPEKTEPYQDLISLFMEQEDYDSACEVAQEGLEHTQDDYFETVISRILNLRKKEKKGKQENIISQELLLKDDEKRLTARFMILDNISSFCYQQYVNAYGDSEVTTAGDKGFQVKFASLIGQVYFRNTREQPDAVDEVGRKVAKRAKPYQVVLTSPTMLFVGYDGSASYQKLKAAFDMKDSILNQDEKGNWWLSFTTHGCNIQLQTDNKGNLFGKKPGIVISPVDLTTVEWEEEEEEEPKVEEEQDDGTFILAGETYHYDIDTLYITNAELDDLTPLSRCKNLKSIVFYECQIKDLTPISGCTALQELDLQESTGGLDLSCLSGLSSIQYLGFHACTDIDDITPIMNLSLKLFHPCGSSVPYEQVEQYMNQHPECEVWFDYYCISGY